MKKLYLTKQENGTQWNYIGDPLHPTSTLDVGIVTVLDKSEIRVDDYGAYVEREFVSEKNNMTIKQNPRR